MRNAVDGRIGEGGRHDRLRHDRVKGLRRWFAPVGGQNKNLHRVRPNVGACVVRFKCKRVSRRKERLLCETRITTRMADRDRFGQSWLLQHSTPRQEVLVFDCWRKLLAIDNCLLSVANSCLCLAVDVGLLSALIFEPAQLVVTCCTQGEQFSPYQRVKLASTIPHRKMVQRIHSTKSVCFLELFLPFKKFGRNLAKIAYAMPAAIKKIPSGVGPVIISSAI